jgi:hypothetical protein
MKSMKGKSNPLLLFFLVECTFGFEVCAWLIGTILSKMQQVRTMKSMKGMKDNPAQLQVREYYMMGFFMAFMVNSLG